MDHHNDGENMRLCTLDSYNVIRIILCAKGGKATLVDMARFNPCRMSSAYMVETALLAGERGERCERIELSLSVATIDVWDIC
jgi:hypothetical protein